MQTPRAPEIDLLLGPHGPLRGRGFAYEDRPQQRAMAHLVAHALGTEQHLVIEAGTGTGKTLAYLLPAALSGRRVVVSTATRALQEQIIEKDLPLLTEVLGLEVQASVLKGRSNYLCLHRMARFDRQPLFPFRGDGERYTAVRDWAEQTEVGDRAEVAAVPETWSTWSELVSTAESCLGQRCELYESCFVVKARARAQESQLIVVNHHLFFSDLALRGEGEAGGGGEILPSYDAVIFDEAHAIEDIATRAFGSTVSSYALRELVRDGLRMARERDGEKAPLVDAADRTERRTKAFFDALALTEGTHPYEALPLDEAAHSLDGLLDGLSLMVETSKRWEGNEEAEALSRRAKRLHDELESFCAKARTFRRPEPEPLEDPEAYDLGDETDDGEGPREDFLVRWAEVRAGGTALHSAPVDVSSLLRWRLLDAVPSCVFTSATLSTNGSFSYFRRGVGLALEGAPAHRALTLPSPFEYAHQAALYLPKHLPEARDPGFAQAVAEEALALCTLSGGGAFILCTSYRNMEAIHGWLEDREIPWPLLKQGDAPKGALIAQFRAEPSVLVATQSFWEGVDVPGEALRLVVIDKLPFAAPDDPVLAARIARAEASGLAPFPTLQLPGAALALKQGFGRLIRTKSDRGVVAICDRRVVTARYGSHFLKSLPPCARHHDLDALQLWWRSADSSPILS